jgi:RNA polymerase sigma-70 factor (ECF subfamily)
MTPKDSAAVESSGSETQLSDDLSVQVSTGSLSVTVTEASSDVEALVARAKSGDRTTFAALYRSYLPNVYKFLYYRVGSRTQTEDMTAEVFLRALRKIGDFTWTGADFGSWLLRIARNLILDEAKSSRSRLEVLEETMPEEAAGAAPTAETQVLESLSNEEVYRAIKRLKPDQQEIITMRFLQGMNVSDVAKVMGKKEGTVRTLQFRGLKALEKLLVSKGYGEGRNGQRVAPGGVRMPSNGHGKGRTEPEAARFEEQEGHR